MVLVDSVGFNLDEIRNPTSPKRPHFIWRFLGNIFLISFFSSVVFVTINFPAYLIIYKFKSNPKSFAVAAPVSENQVKQLADNNLFVSKIGVNAPINWDTSSQNVMETLNSKIAHLSGSGKPGEGKNVFITGHSSSYWWNNGSQNTVFALLPELNQGDEIVVTYNGKIYRYAVSQKKEVSKKDVGDYLLGDKDELTLMTCVPVGTNLKRLLVIATPKQN